MMTRAGCYLAVAVVEVPQEQRPTRSLLFQLVLSATMSVNNYNLEV